MGNIAGRRQDMGEGSHGLHVSGLATTPGHGTGTQRAMQKRFNIDINDNLFTPGDTISYFSVRPASTERTTTRLNSASRPISNVIATNPMELTILPAGGYNRAATTSTSMVPTASAISRSGTGP
jgi:hypothetical protein